MSFTVYWVDDAQTILCWQQTAPATVESFRSAFRLSHEMVADHNHTFHLVIDGTGELRGLPIGEIQNAFRNASPKQELTIIINQDVLTRAIIGVFQKMRLPLTDRITFARDMDDARCLIARRQQP